MLHPTGWRGAPWLTTSARPMPSTLLRRWRLGFARYHGASLETEAEVLADLLRTVAGQRPRAGAVAVTASTARRAALALDGLLRMQRTGA